MKNNFISRSLIGALAFLRDSVFAEEYSLKNGFLQKLDPRMKVVSFVLLFTSAIFLKKYELLVLLYFFCLLLVVISKINLGYFLKRSWIFIPIFSLFIAIPAIFSFISAGEALLTLKLAHLNLTVTREGLQAGVLFVLRVLISVSFAVVLSLTTPHTQLLGALRFFKIPQVFVLTVGMCYRYIYLFVGIIEDTYLAIRSRTQGVMHYSKGQKVVAWNIGHLWQRSHDLSGQVYSAMLARGYKGEPVVLEDFKTKLKDWVYLSTVIIFLVIMLYINKI